MGAKPIVSYHKFDGALSIPEMDKVLEQEISSGADVCKIVTTAKKIEDNLSTLNFFPLYARKIETCLFLYGRRRQDFQASLTIVWRLLHFCFIRSGTAKLQLDK